LGAGVALPLIVGAVASLFIVTDSELVPPELVAEQVRVVPVVSALMIVVSHPLLELMGDSLSITLQLIVTSLTCHPLLPRVPLTLGVITGAVLSGGELTVRVKVA
jgi:hypothetical protein